MHQEKPSLLVLICVAAITVAILFSGCSKPFIPYFSSKSARDDTQATHHWDIFAADVAGQIQLSLENAGIYDPLPVYLETSKGTLFGESFSDLLTVRLEELGFTVTAEKSEAVFTINNSVRVICHVARQITDPLTGSSMMFVRLSEGVTVARGSRETPAEADLPTADNVDEIEFTGDFPPTEVLITTSLYNDTDVLMHNSDIYYIQDPDFWCYMASPQIHEQSSAQTAPVVQEQTIQDETPQTPEQVSESPAEVAPVPVSTLTTDGSTGDTPEQVTEETPAAPEERPRPLPKLKVKGHF